MSIYVGNLSYEVVEDDLKQVFSEYGTVKSIQVPKDRETAAIEALDTAEWMGRNLKVNKAKPREDRGSFGGDRRGNNGGGGGGGYSRRY